MARKRGVRSGIVGPKGQVKRRNIKSTKSDTVRRSSRTVAKFSNEETTGDLTDAYFNSDGAKARYIWVEK